MDLYSGVMMLSILTLIILCLLVSRNTILSYKSKLGFILTTILVILASTCEWLGVLLDDNDVSLRLIHSIVKFMEFAISPLIPVLCAMFILPTRKKFIPLSIVAVHAVIQFLSIFFPITFFVDELNHYYHADFYWIYYIVYSIGIIFLAVQVARFSNRYQNRNNLNLFFAFLIVIIGIITQIINSELRIVWLSVVIGELLFYVFYCDLIQQVDNVTGLLNRTSYDNIITTLHTNKLVLFVDIDDFKAINDSYGHLYGDESLHTIGDILKEVYWNHGLCFRIGGDEFCVLLEYGAKIEELNKLFQNKIELAHQKDERMPYVSMGYANYEKEKGNFADAVYKADMMMYKMKQDKTN